MTATTPDDTGPGLRTFWAINALISVTAVGVLGWILLIRPRTMVDAPPLDLRFMPAVNAMLNAASACCLVAGLVFIRRGARAWHKRAMLTALGFSAAFLVGYLAYHFVHGDTKFAGTGAIRTVYLLILASHVLLSMGVLPMALAVLFFAFRGDFRRHPRLARILFPAWLYVSVTGVVIFFMLRDSVPSMP